MPKKYACYGYAIDVDADTVRIEQDSDSPEGPDSILLSREQISHFIESLEAACAEDQQAEGDA